MAVVVTIAKGYDLGYIWKTQDHVVEHAIGGYYMNAAQAGEPPGRWWGPGAQALGLTPGQTVERKPYDAAYRQLDPRTGAKLGRARGRYPTFAEHLARLQAAEPHATAERLSELEREAARATRQPAAYYDVTVSFSKSISVLHASLRENERRARLDGDQQAAAYWAGREQAFQEVLHRANRAALQYLQAWAGITRTGYHGNRVDGREPGRFETAGLIVTSWLQGTSREGDPQDHVHNQIARVTRTFRDGKWRALDTMSVRTVLGALQAVAATAVACELTREFGVEWTPRAAGRGNEIQGVTQAQMDTYSTRTVQVREKERELAQAWQRKHGRAPTSRELLHIANAATLRSRKGKDAGAVDWDALAARWDATLGGELAGIAPATSNARGPGTQAGEHHAGRAPTGPPTRESQARVLAKALALVSDQHPAWTRHDLLKQLALVLPAETRQMNAEEAQELLLGLAEEALSGRDGQVVCLEAPEWPPLPASLRRELDGRSIYTRPGVAQYATAAQLTLEERLVALAQTQAAPRLPGELAARRLGADLAQLRAELAGRAQHAREHDAPRGLRLDQAAAAWHALTSARTVAVITGPAGTGKTTVLAGIAQAWDGPVFGTATSQNATNGLRHAGIRVAANTTRLLDDLQHGRIPPGSLIVADEASMISVTHLAALTEYAARNRCKLILAGDQEQLAAVEGGGAMTLLADRLGYVQLAEPVRFTAAWERAASLRLRAGDASALDEYDQHGRIRGAPPEAAMDQAARAYVASYLAGRNVPQLHDSARQAYLAGIAALMDDRTRRLGQHIAQAAPAWAITALGPVPADPAARQDWAGKASPIAAYREMYSHDHPGDPIGPEPSHQAPDQRAAWHQAFAALGRADGPGVRAMPDGRLWLLRDTYAAETAWAPRHVGKELRLARLGAFDAALGAVRADAETDAARKAGDHDRAARHDHLAASYRAMRDHYQQQQQAFAQTMAARQEWEQATTCSRRLAIAADAELRRRHPDQKIEPLRSAEPAPLSDTEREQARQASGKEISQIQQEVFRATFQKRQELKEPTEDPSWSGLDILFSARRTLGQAAASSRPSRPSCLRPGSSSVPPSTMSNPRPEADRTIMWCTN